MKKILPIVALFWVLSVNITLAFDLSSALTASENALSSMLSTNAWFVLDWNEDSIIKSLHDKGITIHETRENYKPNQDIRRDEAAKMLTLAIPFISWGSKATVSNSTCTFSDSNLARADLRNILTESCKKWLFKWSNWQFRPGNSITNGQILTVLWRMLYWTQDESIGHYATKYVSLLEKDGYLENLTMPWSERDKPADRWTLAKLLVRVIE